MKITHMRNLLIIMIMNFLKLKKGVFL